jgi:uncharacterized protein YjiS (DUF1127 family)
MKDNRFRDLYSCAPRMDGLKYRLSFKPIEIPISWLPNDADARNAERRQRASGKGNIMNVVRSFNNWRKFRQTLTELGRMSSRELQDLGIDRGDIRTIARASVDR